MMNLTPHAIVIATSEGMVTIPPSGTVARVATSTVSSGSIVVDGATVELVSTIYGKVEGLPEEGTPCIVSAMVAARVPGRDGVFSPRTDNTAIRNEKGQIVAVVGLNVA